MKRIYLTAGALAIAGTLAACGQKSDATAEAPSGNSAAAPAPADGNMAGMNMASSEAAKTAKGAGTVTAVDPMAGTITVAHGPIAEAAWPAMTMAFKAAPPLVQSVKAGDKVAFDLTLKDGGGEITAISKQ
ncbi:copper-binding protein [Phenylobacterium zucineum]|uniref:Copper efflux system periplasmic protein n=1 Tax=Phenylobacterium zucineum (strain HLK1) TaxID=450851 RepID=B4RII8_PHEZH|nr:copper-binding protein [Phenylobacterium zucineum]ACG80163.1 copper efflux system periplasmic protein [Phenylobacterium zucineum HLK1]